MNGENEAADENEAAASGGAGEEPWVVVSASPENPDNEAAPAATSSAATSSAATSFKTWLEAVDLGTTPAEDDFRQFVYDGQFRLVDEAVEKNPDTKEHIILFLTKITTLLETQAETLFNTTPSLRDNYKQLFSNIESALIVGKDLITLSSGAFIVSFSIVWKINKKIDEIKRLQDSAQTVLKEKRNGLLSLFSTENGSVFKLCVDGFYEHYLRYSEKVNNLFAKDDDLVRALRAFAIQYLTGLSDKKAAYKFENGMCDQKAVFLLINELRDNNTEKDDKVREEQLQFLKEQEASFTARFPEAANSWIPDLTEHGAVSVELLSSEMRFSTMQVNSPGLVPAPLPAGNKKKQGNRP